jgi:hypothetical protein
MEPAYLLIFVLVVFAGLVFESLFVFFRLREIEQQVLARLAELPGPLALATEPRLFPSYQRLVSALTELASQSDPLLRDLANGKLASMVEETEGLARGSISFTATETWRSAYQKLLLTLKVQSYYSVAWVRSSAYWNDAPGKQSMQLNYDLVERGFRIERIHILPDSLWPWDEPEPAAEIRPWLEEQQRRRILVRLVRESDLANEPDLLQDFAIYGDRATAVQVLDEHSRTLRYDLAFDRPSIGQALDRWERLSLYAQPWIAANHSRRLMA